MLSRAQPPAFRMQRKHVSVPSDLGGIVTLCHPHYLEKTSKWHYLQLQAYVREGIYFICLKMEAFSYYLAIFLSPSLLSLTGERMSHSWYLLPTPPQ